MKFNPEDIGSLEGKVIVVTGGTGGIGKETVLNFARHSPTKLILTGRNAERGADVVSQCAALGVTADFIECDLESLASVKKAAAQIDRLDILVCNAGVAFLPPGLTKDGYEQVFATNHLSHALLIKELLPLLLQSEGRVVILASAAASMAGNIRLDQMKTTQDAIGGRWGRYAQSKLANILYAGELGRRYPTITSVVVHPGIVNTHLLNNLPAKDRYFAMMTEGFSYVEADQGSWNTLWAATADKSTLENGFMYKPVGVKATPFRRTGDQKLAAELWDWTQKELEGY